MKFEKNYLPQFREADRDGYIGLRGYMNYFQDMVTQYMYNIKKGNDILPEKYGTVWMFTKYKMQVKQKADFSGELYMKTWIPDRKLSAVVHQYLLISKNGEEYARGCVESCLFNISKNRLVRLKEIDFPTDITENEEFYVPDFQKLSVQSDDMEFAYKYHVRYTDLDKTGHMTNLKYIDMFLNAFDSRFFEKFQIRELELHFLSQCFEGETLYVYKKVLNETIFLTAMRENQTPCATACILAKLDDKEYKES